MISIALHKDTQLSLTNFQKDFIQLANSGKIDHVLPQEIRSKISPSSSDQTISSGKSSSWIIPNYPLWAFHDWDFFKTDKSFTSALLDMPQFDGNKIIFPLTITTESGKTVQTHIHFATVVTPATAPSDTASATSSISETSPSTSKETQGKSSTNQSSSPDLLDLLSDDTFWSKLSEKKEEAFTQAEEKFKSTLQNTNSETIDIPDTPESSQEKARSFYASTFLINFPIDLRLLKKGTCVQEKNCWSLYDECWLKKIEK